MAVVLSLRATTAEGVAEWSGLLDGVPVEYADFELDTATETLTVHLQQPPDADGVERPGLPPREHVRSTTWYEEYRRPVVAWELVVRQVTGLELEEPDPGDLDVGLIVHAEYSERDRLLTFHGDPAAEPVRVSVRELDAELRLTDRVVGWERLRIGRPWPWESTAPWTERDERS